MTDHGATPSYPQQPYPYGPPPVVYASWIRRVGGYLIDSLIGVAAAIPAYVLVFVGVTIGSEDLHTTTDRYGGTHTTGDWNGTGTPLVVIGALLYLVPIAVFIWNICIRQGRTGYSIGKGVLGIRLIGESSGRPIGGGLSFVRQLAHIVDSLVCYLGWLWPLWDAKCQTLGDKIMSTVVVVQPKEPQE